MNIIVRLDAVAVVVFAVNRLLMIPIKIINRFYEECKRRYTIKLWKTFTDCFNCLPVAAIGEYLQNFIIIIPYLGPNSEGLSLQTQFTAMGEC